MSTIRPLVAAALLLVALAACGGKPADHHAAGRPAHVAVLADAELKAALPGVADVPNGYVVKDTGGDTGGPEDEPDCAAMKVLEGTSAAQADYVGDGPSLSVRLVQRTVPEATGDIAVTRRLPKTCPKIGWTDSDTGDRYAFTVTRADAPALGDESAAIQLAGGTGDRDRSIIQIVLARQAGVEISLSETYSADRRGDPALLARLGQRAVTNVDRAQRR